MHHIQIVRVGHTMGNYRTFKRHDWNVVTQSIFNLRIYVSFYHFHSDIYFADFSTANSKHRSGS